jgi:hypothetical protein
MGLLTFSSNITLDGCVDHQEGIADDEIYEKGCEVPPHPCPAYRPSCIDGVCAPY